MECAVAIPSPILKELKDTVNQSENFVQYYIKFWHRMGRWDEKNHTDAGLEEGRGEDEEEEGELVGQMAKETEEDRKEPKKYDRYSRRDRRDGGGRSRSPEDAKRHRRKRRSRFDEEEYDRAKRDNRQKYVSQSQTRREGDKDASEDEVSCFSFL